MKTFKDKVVVITGGASGIGRGIADRCVQEGMKVVLADIEMPALEKAESELKASGADVLSVRTNVSQKNDVDILAKKTIDTYGGVHLLFNNAGVGTGAKSVWESTINDWEWAMGANLWGVIHGLRSFVPIMLNQDSETHIVNTASIAGLISFSASAPYHVTKHAVVALSEKLYYDLSLISQKINVSVLCPGWVKSRIRDCERNRPENLRNQPDGDSVTTLLKSQGEQPQAIQKGISPDVVADDVFQAIREEKFYIMTHPELAPYIKARADAVVQEHNPTDLTELAVSI